MIEKMRVLLRNIVPATFDNAFTYLEQLNLLKDKLNEVIDVVNKGGGGGGTTYTAGDGINIDEDVISVDTETIAPVSEVERLENYVNDELDKKQDTLTAGANIKIENNVISATGGGGGGTVYTAGEGINISGDVISVDTETIASVSALELVVDNFSTAIDDMTTAVNELGTSKQDKLTLDFGLIFFDNGKLGVNLYDEGGLGFTTRGKLLVSHDDTLTVKNGMLSINFESPTVIAKIQEIAGGVTPTGGVQDTFTYSKA